jgi:hypothetical protein
LQQGGLPSTRQIDVTLTIFLLITAGLVVLTLLGGKARFLEPVAGYRLAVSLFLTSIASLILLTYLSGTNQLVHQHNHLVKVRNCLHTAQSPADPCLTIPFPNAQELWPMLQYLRSIHYGGL